MANEGGVSSATRERTTGYAEGCGGLRGVAEAVSGGEGDGAALIGRGLIGRGGEGVAQQCYWGELAAILEVEVEDSAGRRRVVRQLQGEALSD
ncbi:uncharacterized protein A4U43_C07F27680 [Asparagus officinalis]|uniref:Uncharacterized protein n=1 Tax=Asparagus officinalis TaxID=4686 RepID=A0A5P1EKM3_ASPOF|nr:uncharacterized protein A4U43_C07F27680 [Asparagus officinalis]